MSAVVIIPARLASTRLPDKLLLAESGKPLICHTVERALQCRHVSSVIVSADDDRILTAVRDQPVICHYSGKQENGSERVAWTYRQLANKLNAEWFVNWQADEPTLSPTSVDALIMACQIEMGAAAVVTLACPASEQEATDPNTVKVVRRHDGLALYFSRSRIPYAGQALRHIGIYAFARRFFGVRRRCERSAFDGERLEQLAWLEAGLTIGVVQLPYPDGGGIDVRADYDRFLACVDGGRT